MLLERSIFPSTIDFHRETEKFTVKFIIIIAFILIDNWLTNSSFPPLGLPREIDDLMKF